MDMRRLAGLTAGMLIFILMMALDAPAGLSSAGWQTAAVAALMAVWWITEALPIPATALLPVVLFPLLGISGMEATLKPYAHPLIFLFMGGFIIAIAMEQWDLHRRIALNIVRFVGTEPRAIVGGFIIASAFLSMWVSNTATALMMLPIAMSILKLADRQSEEEEAPHRNFALCLLLAVAYGCNIGGLGTLIGTPPNALLAGFMADNYGVEISFARWMLFGLPLVLISIPLVYGVLTRLVYPIGMEKLAGGSGLIRDMLEDMGRISGPEMKVAGVFTATAILWMTRPLLTGWIPQLSDTGIAIAAALSFFYIPSRSERKPFLLEWDDVEELPWGVLILFGGGLSLASAISTTGLAGWIGQGVQGFSGWPIPVMLLLVTAMIIFLTEITSNTATAAAFLPIMGSVAAGLGQDPLFLAMPAALAASCAFMLPVATPPNAIVYGSNRISIPDMARAGLWLNMLFIFLISLAVYLFLPAVFG